MGAKKKSKSKARPKRKARKATNKTTVLKCDVLKALLREPLVAESFLKVPPDVFAVCTTMEKANHNKKEFPACLIGAVLRGRVKETMTIEEFDGLCRRASTENGSYESIVDYFDENIKDASTERRYKLMKHFSKELPEEIVFKADKNVFIK